MTGKVLLAATLLVARPAIAQQSRPEQAESVTWDSIVCPLGGQCDRLTARGLLFATPGAKSVVLVSHGSQGIDSRMFDYVDALKEAGFAALVIDHWRPRGIGVTHDDYAAASRKGGNEYNMAADSLTAAQWLRAERGYARVGSIGESQGGGAAVMLQQKFAQAGIESGVRRLHGKDFRVAPIDAVVGMYGPCFYRNALRDAYVGTPFLFITGALDDETPSRLCEKHVDWMNARGGNASIVVLPGVGHSFDAPYASRWASGQPQYARCDILVDATGVTDLNSGARMSGSDPTAMFARCMGRGYTTGHRGNRFVAVPHWIGFFKQHL